MGSCLFSISLKLTSDKIREVILALWMVIVWFSGFFYSSFLGRMICLPLPSPASYTSWLRGEVESAAGFGGAPVVSGLALEAVTGGLQLCPEWLTKLSSTYRAQGCAVLCFWALGSVLRTAWLSERKQVDTTWAGGSPRSPTPPGAKRQLLPLENGVLIIPAQRCQAAERGKLVKAC